MCSAIVASLGIAFVWLPASFRRVIKCIFACSNIHTPPTFLPHCLLYNFLQDLQEKLVENGKVSTGSSRKVCNAADSKGKNPRRTNLTVIQDPHTHIYYIYIYIDIAGIHRWAAIERCKSISQAKAIVCCSCHKSSTRIEINLGKCH